MIPNSGSYRLHLYISRRRTIIIGALGKFSFPGGHYVYSGSAMRNLSQRIERHKRSTKKLHWHIDYLLADKYIKIQNIEVFNSIEREECSRNLALLNSGLYEAIVPGFGSSDCRNCPAHLLRRIDAIKR